MHRCFLTHFQLSVDQQVTGVQREGFRARIPHSWAFSGTMWDIPELPVGQLFGKASSSLEHCTPPLHQQASALWGLGWNKCSVEPGWVFGCAHTPWGVEWGMDPCLGGWDGNSAQRGCVVTAISARTLLQNHTYPKQPLSLEVTINIFFFFIFNSPNKEENILFDFQDA